MRRTSIAILVALAGTVAARPDAKPRPPSSPAPAKALDVFAPYLKTWTCIPGGRASPANRATVRLAFERERDKVRVSIAFDRSTSKATLAFVGTARVGSDPIAKPWVMDGVDGKGRAIHLHAATADITASSMQWEGDPIAGGSEVSARLGFEIYSEWNRLALVVEVGGVRLFDHACI
jgi:hypothetical protein